MPVAEINLGAGDSIFFEHHVMLWKDINVPLSVMQLGGGFKRAFAGMPFIISVANGPGRISVYQRDACLSCSCRCTPAWSSTCANMPSC